MPKYLIIVLRDKEAKSYFFNDYTGVNEFIEMLRDFNHPYELYRYDDEYKIGYVRLVKN